MPEISKDQTTELGAPIDIEAGGVVTSSTILSRRMNLDERSRVEIKAGEIERPASDRLVESVRREESRVTRTPMESIKFDQSNSASGFQHPTAPTFLDGAKVDGLPISGIVPGSTPGDRLSAPLPGSKIGLGAIRLRHLKQEVLDFIRGTGGEPILRPVRYPALDPQLKALTAKGERLPNASDVISVDPASGSIVPPMSTNYTHARHPIGMVRGDENNPDIDGSIKSTIEGQPVMPTGEWVDSNKWQAGVSFAVTDEWGGPTTYKINAGWTFGDGESTYEEEGLEPWSLSQSFGPWGAITGLGLILPRSAIDVGPQAIQITPNTWSPQIQERNPNGLLLAVDFTIKEIQPVPRSYTPGGIAWATLTDAGGHPWVGNPSHAGNNESFSQWHNTPGKHTAFIRLRRPYHIFAHPTQPWPEPIGDQDAEDLWKSERRSYYRFVIVAAIFATKITITDPRVRFVGLSADPDYRRWAMLENPTEDWKSSL